jgi:Tfp pilus tip-associated adhesin PilY1
VGSGYFPPIEDLLPGRGNAGPRAGDTLYLIDADTGSLIGNTSGAGCSGTGCLTVGEKAGNNGRKNALQADPTAAGESGSPTVSKAYLGDVDGRYWKFTLDSFGSISKSLMLDTLQPIYASSALLFIGSADVYALFSTGSDLLPSNAPGGTGIFKLYGLKDNGASATTKFSINLAAVTDTAGLATGERPSTSPSVAGDIVFYTTTTESATTPCNDFSAKLYAVTYAGGAAYDSNNDGRLGTNESPVARTMAGRATAPFIVDQHLYLGTSSSGSSDGSGPGDPPGGDPTSKVEAFGDPEDFNNGMGQVGVRILSWREIR